MPMRLLSKILIGLAILAGLSYIGHAFCKSL